MKIKLLLSLTILLTLSGCGCYESQDDAWKACNNKYNGKCRYLGSDFKICEKNEFSIFSIFGNKAKKRCLKIVRAEGISESYCDTERERDIIFSSNL